MMLLPAAAFQQWLCPAAVFLQLSCAAAACWQWLCAAAWRQGAVEWLQPLQLEDARCWPPREVAVRRNLLQSLAAAASSPPWCHEMEGWDPS
ncbi:unnamed protein product, partial [Prunus brigantina]